MTNEELLILIRKDRPTQVIHEVFSFTRNEKGMYSVQVDMESKFFDTTVLHSRLALAYPVSMYEKMSEAAQFAWRWKN